eukprot:1145520-Pelagomonas_calceolata.AAC.1
MYTLQKEKKERKEFMGSRKLIRNTLILVMRLATCFFNSAPTTGKFTSKLDRMSMKLKSKLGGFKSVNTL